MWADASRRLSAATKRTTSSWLVKKASMESPAGSELQEGFDPQLSGGVPAPDSPGVYVYGVVPGAGEPLHLDADPVGDSSGELTSIEAGGLRAIVSEVGPGWVRASRQNLNAHAGVLAQALEAGTVLPMQFGVVFGDAEAVRRDLLEGARDELVDLLAQLEGRVELMLKGYYREDVLLREIAADVPEVGDLQAAIRELPEDASYPQRVRLGELIAGEVEARRQHDTEQTLAALEPFAVAAYPGDPQHEWMALNFAFLVERESVGEFDHAANELAAAHEGRVDLRYVGPLPPHSFANFSLTRQVEV